jgi:hypothetical protein
LYNIIMKSYLEAIFFFELKLFPSTQPGPAGNESLCPAAGRLDNVDYIVRIICFMAAISLSI